MKCYVRTVGNDNFIQLPVFATATLPYLQFTGTSNTSYHSKHFSDSFSCNVSYIIKYKLDNYSLGHVAMRSENTISN